MKRTLTNVSEDKMTQLAAVLAGALMGGEVLNLHGDVGAGKTTFTRSLAQSLGVTDPVQSPTFTIANHYETSRGIHLGHYDFYRLDNPGIMKQELEETLSDHKTVVVIEWGDIIEDVLPGDHLDMFITPTTEDLRDVVLEAYGEKAAKLLEVIT